MLFIPSLRSTRRVQRSAIVDTFTPFISSNKAEHIDVEEEEVGQQQVEEREGRGAGEVGMETQTKAGQTLSKTGSHLRPSELLSQFRDLLDVLFQEGL